MPNRIELNHLQFANGGLPFPNNCVLVEMTYCTDGVKTKGGIIVGFNKDVLYAEGEDAHNADLQEVSGIVTRVPEKLYFNPKDPNSMLWETDMELQVGDLVWFGIMESSNAQEILCEGRLYKIIPYADIIVARRRTEVIVLNGYALCQTVNRQKISDLDVISEESIDTTRCIVRYVGKPNKRYKVKNHIDHKDLKPGDVVLLQPRTSFWYLERKRYLANFNGDELYIVVPRRKIVMVIDRD